MAVQPDLHVFAHRVVVQGPADFDDQGGAVFEAHKTGCKILDVHVGRDSTGMPDRERAGLFGQFATSHTGDRHGFGVPHQPQRQVEHVHADVDTGAAAAQFLLHEASRGDERIAAQHPAPGMIDVAQSTGGDFFLHGLRYASEAEVLGRHQFFAGFVAGCDHRAHLGRGRCERLFADDVLAGLEGGNGQWGVVHVGRADVDDVDARVTQDFGEVGRRPAHTVARAPGFEGFGINICACNDFGIGRRRPAGHVGVGNPTNTDDRYFQWCHDSLLCVQMTFLAHCSPAFVHCKHDNRPCLRRFVCLIRAAGKNPAVRPDTPCTPTSVASAFVCRGYGSAQRNARTQVPISSHAPPV